MWPQKVTWAGVDIRLLGGVRRRADVVPALGLRGFRVHEQTVAVLDEHRQLGKKPALRDVEPSARPFDRDLGLIVHGLGRGVHRLVVIAADGDGALGDQPHRGIHDPFRIGTIADEIAKHDEPLRALGAGRLQACLERLPVAVDIREDSEKHAPSTLKFLLEADKANLREVNKMRQRGAVDQRRADAMVKSAIARPWAASGAAAAA